MEGLLLSLLGSSPKTPSSLLPLILVASLLSSVEANSADCCCGVSRVVAKGAVVKAAEGAAALASKKADKESGDSLMVYYYWRIV